MVEICSRIKVSYFWLISAGPLKFRDKPAPRNKVLLPFASTHTFAGALSPLKQTSPRTDSDNWVSKQQQLNSMQIRHMRESLAKMRTPNLFTVTEQSDCVPARSQAHRPALESLKSNMGSAAQTLGQAATHRTHYSGLERLLT